MAEAAGADQLALQSWIRSTLHPLAHLRHPAVAAADLAVHGGSSSLSDGSCNAGD